MDKDKLMDAMSQIDDDILGETNKIRLKSQEKSTAKITRITRKPWFKIASAAAVLVIIIAAGGIVGNNIIATNSYDSSGAGMLYKGVAENYLLDSNLSVDGDEFVGFDGIYDTESAMDLPGKGSVMGVMPTVSITPSVSNGIIIDNNEPAEETDSTANDEKSSAMTEKDVRTYIDTSLITCTLTLAEGAKTSGENSESPTCNGKTLKKFGNINISLLADAKYWISVSGNFLLYVKNGNEYEIVNPSGEQLFDNTTYSIGQYVGAASISQNIDLSAYENLSSGKYALVKDADVHITIDGTEYIVPEKLYFEFEVIN